MRLTALLLFATTRLLLATALGCEGVPEVSGDAGLADAASASPCGAVTRTCAEVMAGFTAESADVSVSCDATAGTFTIRASGLPNYASNQSTPNVIGVQDWVLTLPLQPSCADAPVSVLASRG